MAAGLGSRYGGVKQIDAVGPNGEILMEYAVYDALRAGFDKVVFIVTAAILPEIREKFGAALASKGAKAEYVVQDYSSLPGFFRVPDCRKKPYGTAHAVLCTRKAVAEPFAVINADDYYGVSGFQAIYDEITSMPAGRATMVGYQLRNTVSTHGTVTRGVCAVAEGALQSVTETYKIAVFPDGSIRDTAADPAGRLLDPAATVSMNFWGFRPEIYDDLDAYLVDFLRRLPENDEKSECLLPALVDKCIHDGALTVSVLHTDARWFGMTYHEDHPAVQEEIRGLHKRGVYPARLW